MDVSRFRGDIRAEWESLKEHDGKYSCCDRFMITCNYMNLFDLYIIYLIFIVTVVFLLSIMNPQQDAAMVLGQFSK